MKTKGNLISLISVIFILLVSMAMTGCISPLATAAYSGQTNIVRELLNNKDIDINEILIGCSMNSPTRGYTPLMCATEKGHIEVVKLLLDKGANVNGKSYMTPLHIAVINGHAEIVRLLLDSGADLSLVVTSSFKEDRHVRGKTPLQIAQEKGQNTIIARMLIEAEEKQFKKYTKEDKKSSPETTSLQTAKSDIDELPLIKAKPNKNSYAIVIGIENYRQKLPKADYAVADAKTMTEYLTKVMGYSEENVVTLTNEHAAKSDFEKYFEKWLPNNAEKDGSVFIYYSGHGAPNVKTGDAFLVPYDGDPSFIDQTGYSLKRLYENLGKLQAKEIIVALDSCFSGAGGKSVIAKGARPLVMNLEQDIKLSKNMIVMSASSGDQISSTYDEKGHGLFTYFMLKGIKNEDVTRQDGSIKMDDLFSYLKPQVERIARKQYNNEQTPQLIVPDKQKVFLRD
ncbi:MAG: ankyrin repeat domain-containing protein [Thermodesulfovibrionales bacterium]|nr:ankyrin repeat domain-containing protein [Thermodesulfovibrionales bacterium]